MSPKDYKNLVVRLATLCEQRWPNEWPVYFRGTQLDFKNWLNEKTELDVSHTNLNDRPAAIEAWVNAIEAME